MRIRQNPCSRHLLRALACLLCLFGTTFAQSSSPTGADLVRQVDHILILTNDPKPVFRLLSEKLALPVAWPYQSYGAFASGGVSVGNVNFEVVKMAPDTARSARNQAQKADKGLAAFALEPSSVSEIVAWLDARGLKHGMPAPFYQKDRSGKEQLSWTVIQTSLPPAQTAFFCKYTFNVPARRARLAQVLKDHGGGPLGIESATELVLGVRDLTAALRDWQNLLGRASTLGARWELGSGPAIHLVASDEDRLTILRIKVKSLGAARAFLRSQNLLGLDTPHEISLRRSAVGGADIRLIE